MEYFWLALGGAIVGAVAKLIIPGTQPGGIFVTMIFGIIGAVVGSFLRQMITGADTGTFGSVFDFWSWVWAVIGSIIVILGWTKGVAPLLKKKTDNA